MLASAAQADIFGFQRSFGKDDDAALFALNLGVPTTLTVQTLSWAGGVNGAGQVVPGGGFAPVLSLFDGTQALLQLAVGSSGICGNGHGNSDPTAGTCWDAWLSVPLSAGSYTLVLTQDDNLPVGPTLLDGFTRTGQPNYTGTYIGSATAHFIDVSGMQRTGSWSLDLSGSAISVSQVPEPAPCALWLASLAIALVLFRKEAK